MRWSHVITQIQQRHGLTQPQIAERVGCSQAAISHLHIGRTPEPRYSVGQRLLELANSDAAPRHPAPGASDIEPAAAGQGV